jgi:outer membrane immunogenic protein
MGDGKQGRGIVGKSACQCLSFLEIPRKTTSQLPCPHVMPSGGQPISREFSSVLNKGQILTPFQVGANPWCEPRGSSSFHQNTKPMCARLENNEKGGMKLMLRKAIMLFGVLLLMTLGLPAQEVRSEISVQGTGFFTKDSNGQGVSQRSTEAGGLLTGYRFRLTPWLSAETNYGFSRNTQGYSPVSGNSRVQADVHQATAGFVFNLPHKVGLKFSPYLLAEGGALIFNPTGNGGAVVPGADTQAKGAFVYGGGADWPLLKHVTLRTEYRGLVYKAPDFGLKSLNTDAVTHTAQPSLGFAFHF